jgi:hypothetical protein
MTAVSSHSALGALLVGLLLAGCARQPVLPANGAGQRHPSANIRLPNHTGIASCDDYLSSYLACHRAAAIYPPDQLSAHYQTMRTSLLRDSTDPGSRPQLAARCAALTAQLREVLQGKPCTVKTAPNHGAP